MQPKPQRSRFYLCHDCGVRFVWDAGLNRSASLCIHCGSRRIELTDEPECTEFIDTEAAWSTEESEMT